MSDGPYLLKIPKPEVALKHLYFRYFDKGALFEGHDAMFKREVSHASVYGEYGCGASTSWVLRNTSARVLSVDTSKEWVDKVRQDFSLPRGRLDLKHVDVGLLSKWGMPAGYAQRINFVDYTDCLWRENAKPDLVFVDGRFRVACFLTSLKFAEAGTRIIFDDYTNRPHYHVVEAYADRQEDCGRQSLFVVPPKPQMDVERLESDIQAFRHVMD